MIEVSNDSDDQVRAAAIVALGSIGGDAAVAAILARCDDRSEYVRFFAGDALRRLCDPRAVSAYVDVVAVGNSYLTEEALRVLVPLTGSDFGLRADAPSVERLEAAARFRQWLEAHADAIKADPGGVLRLESK